MTTLEISTQQVDALLQACIRLDVVGVEREVLFAEIWPSELSTRAVSGVVGWEGSQTLSFLVTGGGFPSAWRQRCMLMWLAAGAQMAQKLPVLCAHRWQTCSVRMQDVGSGGDTVQISVSRKSWLATLTRTVQGALPVALAVPLELQTREVGRVLAEMSSLLLLQRPWLEMPGTSDI